MKNKEFKRIRRIKYDRFTNGYSTNATYVLFKWIANYWNNGTPKPIRRHSEVELQDKLRSGFGVVTPKPSRIKSKIQHEK